MIVVVSVFLFCFLQLLFFSGFDPSAYRSLTGLTPMKPDDVSKHFTHGRRVEDATQLIAWRICVLVINDDVSKRFTYLWTQGRGRHPTHGLEDRCLDG